MPRFIDLITECLKDAKREVLQKRRVVNVVVHGGGWKRNGKTNGTKFMPFLYSFRFKTKNRGWFIYSVKMGYFRIFYIVAALFPPFEGRWDLKQLGHRCRVCGYHILGVDAIHTESACVRLGVGVFCRVWVWWFLMSMTVPYLVYSPIIALSKSGTRSRHPACSIIPPFDDEQAVFTATGPFPLIFFVNCTVTWCMMYIMRSIQWFYAP